MSGSKPYEPPRVKAETRIFRARKSTRYIMVALAGFAVVFAIGLTALSIYWLIESRESFFSIFTGLYFSQIAVGLVIVAMTGYWALYWWKYRIVVDDEFTYREGLPHPVDRRKRIAHKDVFRITHGARTILKIIPKEGAPLAAGLKGLEGEPTALIEALRERIPENRFDSNLEASIFDRGSSDRFGYFLGGGLIIVTILSLAGIYIRDLVLERTAWFEVAGLPEEQRIGLIDIADDGAIWILSEGPLGGTDRAVGLTRIEPNGATNVINLSEVSALRQPLDQARIEGPFPIDSLAIDSENRPWIIFRGDRGAFAWDGKEWTHVPATNDDLEFEISDLVRAGDFLWAQVPEHNALFRIDTDSFETETMGPVSWDYETGTVELKPYDLRGTSGNGAVLFGEFSSGGPGFVAIEADGSIAFSSAVLGAPKTATWSARSATPDRQGQIHVVFDSREVCVSGFRKIKVGTRLVNTDWVWRDLVYQADCEVDPRFDEVQIDTEGRVWIKPNDGAVVVFPEPSSDTTVATVDPLAVYTRDNSGYNDGRLVVGSDGHLLGVQGWRSVLVTLDARGEDLPAPLPAWFAWFLDHPYVPQFAVLLVMLPFAIALARRNFGR